MKVIPSEKLVKGNTYYIESTIKEDGHSSKKIGVFDKLEYYFGTPFARFTQLKDLPNATMPTSMGTASKNKYSTLCHKFWLPQMNIIFLKYIIDDKTKTNIGTSYYSSD